MQATISAVTLAVKDVEASKRFYAEGLGWPIAQDMGQWVAFALEGGGQLGLLEREALAADAGTDPPAGGFSGVTFSYLVGSAERVEELLAEAEAAGGTIARPAHEAQWGGYDGYFADPDGYLWKVAFGPGAANLAE
jgi:catechol 2,3-dioxygenase-like lactoylglutathione lyase family enzyme